MGGVCPDRRRARRTASTRLEVAIQSAFQKKMSVHHGRPGLLDGVYAIVRRMRAFAVTWASDMGCGGGS